MATTLNTREKAVTEEIYLKLKNKGLKDIEIAKKLCVTKYSLSRAKKKWDLKKGEVAIVKAVAELQDRNDAPVVVNDLQDLLSKLQKQVVDEKIEEKEFKKFLYTTAKKIIEDNKGKIDIREIAYLIQAIN